MAWSSATPMCMVTGSACASCSACRDFAMMLAQRLHRNSSLSAVKLRLSLLTVETGGSVEAASSRNTITTNNGPF
jgi:hypothetical protein